MSANCCVLMIPLTSVSPINCLADTEIQGQNLFPTPLLSRTNAPVLSQGVGNIFKIGCLSSHQMKADRGNFLLETFVFVTLRDMQKIKNCGDLVVGTFL